MLSRRSHARGFAIGGATPHPPFGHLPPEGEGTDGCRFVGCGWVGCLWVPRARPEGDRHIFPRSWAEVGWNLFGRDQRGGRENEPVPGAMAVGGGVGSCGGVGCSVRRCDDGRRTSSPLAARLPSPARPAVPNTSDLVAGEGPGVGEHRVVVPAMGCEGLRHWQRDPSSALWAPSPGGGRHRWLSIRWMWAGWVPVGVGCASGGGPAHFPAVLGGGGLASLRVGLRWGAGK